MPTYLQLLQVRLGLQGRTDLLKNGHKIVYRVFVIIYLTS